MVSTVYYEWGLEERFRVASDDHEEDEIIDTHHRDTYRGLMADMSPDDPASETYQAVVLIRNHDTQGRSWAYMEDGKLPSHFRDAWENEVCPVPQRYIIDVAAYAASLKKED